MTFSEAMTQQAGHYLSGLLEATGGNVSKAAEIAGVHRGHFYKLCQRYCGHVPRPHKPPPPNPFATWHLPRSSTGVSP